MSYLLTGAGGFVGRELSRRLAENGYPVAACHRRESVPALPLSKICVVGEINGSTAWGEILLGQECIIHLANTAHVMDEPAVSALDLYRETNVKGTLHLARQALAAGVKRFVYLSSIKVNGESTGQTPFCIDDAANPRDPYAISKYEAEVGLQGLCRDSAMELVIIRPPLVYGPGVKGNLAALVRWIDSDRPLPFGALTNRRDLIGLNNLVDLIITCIDHPDAAGQVFLCSDNRPVSTPELVRFIAAARRRPARLWNTSPGILKMLLALVGKRDAYDRLGGDLRIDMGRTQEMLGWKPPYSVEESMQWAFGGQDQGGVVDR